MRKIALALGATLILSGCMTPMDGYPAGGGNGYGGYGNGSVYGVTEGSGGYGNGGYGGYSGGGVSNSGSYSGLGGYGLPQGVNKGTLGALGGAALGGYAGSQIGEGSGKLAATAAGTLFGALLGNGIGTSLDRADVAYARQAAEQAALRQQPMRWEGQNGNYGVVTPGPLTHGPSGEVCREYQHNAYVGGRSAQIYGHACQQADGSWRVAG